MPPSPYMRPTHSASPPIPPLLQPQPARAPLLPPVHVVDLMTDAGSAAFGARWRAKEAKLVECPALSDSRPESKTTYDVEPHVELIVFAAIQGFNMPNRLVLGDSLGSTGDKFEIAVFAINGPLSAAPANFLWFRAAKVEFFR